eukprot:2464324-Ditylum_brightwellii.AAC.1
MLAYLGMDELQRRSKVTPFIAVVNRYQESYYQCLQTIGDLSSLTTTPADVSLEPSGVSDAFVKVRPLDVATEGAAGIMGTGVTVAGNPPLQETIGLQTLANKENLRNLDIKKWRGSSCSNQVKYTDDTILKAPSGSNGTPRRISMKEAGAIVIGKMLDKDIWLIPVSIDGWLCEGEAIKWFKTGNSKQKFDYSPYHFEGSIGAEEGMAMCSFTIDDTNLCWVLHKANWQWKQLN